MASFFFGDERARKLTLFVFLVFHDPFKVGRHPRHQIRMNYTELVCIFSSIFRVNMFVGDNKG